MLCSSLSGVVFMQVALYFQMYQADRKRLKSIVCPSLLDALVHSLITNVSTPLGSRCLVSASIMGHELTLIVVAGCWISHIQP